MSAMNRYALLDRTGKTRLTCLATSGPHSLRRFVRMRGGKDLPQGWIVVWRGQAKAQPAETVTAPTMGELRARIKGLDPQAEKLLKEALESLAKANLERAEAMAEKRKADSDKFQALAERNRATAKADAHKKELDEATAALDRTCEERDEAIEERDKAREMVEDLEDRRTALHDRRIREAAAVWMLDTADHVERNAAEQDQRFASYGLPRPNSTGIMRAAAVRIREIARALAIGEEVRP